MADPWQILRSAGLPLSIESSGRRPSQAELGQAVRAAIGDSPTGRDAEALAAFVLAWSHHWPSSFAAACDEAVLDWAAHNRRDPDRYLKLRRIALANLAQVL